MGEENESLYDNLILESIRNNEEIPICRIENTPETPLIGSTPYLPSENIVNTSENMENVRPLSVENSRTKLENYIDEKYDQVAIKYLKEKILNEVKQKFSMSFFCGVKRRCYRQNYLAIFVRHHYWSEFPVETVFRLSLLYF